MKTTEQAFEALDRGENERAASIARALIGAGNDTARAHHVLAIAEARSGRIQRAVAAIERALRLAPDDPDILCTEADIQLHRGRVVEAETAYGRAASLARDPRRALLGMAVARNRLGRLEDAIEACRRLLEIDPDHHDARKIVADIDCKLGRYAQAIEAYERIVQIAPGRLDCLFNLGIAYRSTARIHESVTCFERILAAAPDHVDALHGIALSLLQLRNSHRAIPYLERIVERRPEVLHLLYMEYRKICAWERCQPIEKTLDRQTDDGSVRGHPVAETPFGCLCRTDDPARHLRIARSWASRIMASLPGERTPPAPEWREGERIRIGYLSNDLYDHATAHLAMPLFTEYDRTRFACHVYAYSHHTVDAYTRRIADGVDRFHDITDLGFDQAAQRIRDDGIHVLIDLKGYTADARLEIPALRPAPVQVAYLGFPGSTGMEAFDYMIADRTVVPEEHRQHYSERIVFMPDAYQVTDGRQPISNLPIDRSDAGLPSNGIVFACFNQPYKIDARIFSVWMSLLRDVPDSVLWLLDYTTRSARELRRHADRHGVDGRRLIFAGRMAKPEHLRRLQLADIALDTLVYNGHTTTTDCLWAGVPVITLPGRSFASRVAASLLRASGLEELIADDLDDYRELAMAIARDPGRLRRLSATLRDERTTAPLFDTRRFMVHFETALARIWRRHVTGRPPADIDVASDEPPG